MSPNGGLTAKDGNLSIVWLGMPLRSDAAAKYPAVSPAGSKWQWALVRELHRPPGRSVQTIGHVPEPAWPRGRLLMTASAPLCDWPAVSLRYLNVPFWRIVNLVIAYLTAVIQYRARAQVLITYNSYWYNIIPAIMARRMFGTKWIAIIADVEDSTLGRVAHRVTESEADGCAYLSHRLAQGSKTRRAIHLPGGIGTPYSTNDAESDNLVRICYAGALSVPAGAFAVAEAVLGSANPTLRLDMFGHGDPSGLRELVRDDPRINVHGLVSERQLRNAMSSSDVLVNPRHTSGHFAETTFPSKLLDYIRYRLPIVSTITPGMSPEYLDVLIPAASSSPDDLREALKVATGLSSDAREAYRDRLDKFVRDHSWGSVAERFARFVRDAPDSGLR